MMNLILVIFSFVFSISAFCETIESSSEESAPNTNISFVAGVVSGLPVNGAELGHRINSHSIIEYAFYRRPKMSEENLLNMKMHSFYLRHFFGGSFNVRAGLGIRELKESKVFTSNRDGSLRADYEITTVDSTFDMTIGNEWQLFDQHLIIGFDWIGSTITLFKIKSDTDVNYLAEDYPYSLSANDTKKIRYGVPMDFLKLKLGIAF